MARDSLRITAGELQKKIEFRGQKTFDKKLSKSIYITTCCLGGFQKNKKRFHQKTNLQHIQLSDTTGTGFYGQM